MVLKIESFTATSGLEPHYPSVQVDVPSNYKIVGGGAHDNWDTTDRGTDAPGNMLTASYPISLTSWFAAGKDHDYPSPATISAYALAIYDPLDEWDVVIIPSPPDRGPEHYPQAVATVPPGYTLTGGGAQVHYEGPGNILTASFPSSETSWEARSKDQDDSDTATITAYAIGIKHRFLGRVEQIRKSATGSVAHWPTAQVSLDTGWILSGGGAIDNWESSGGPGNLLTATYPIYPQDSPPGWFAAGKDHTDPGPANITVYAIGIRGLL